MHSEFDYEITHEKCPGLEYGVINGNCHVVLIKLPRNETIFGYRNKYAKMAKELRNRLDCSVICANNIGDDVSRKYDVKILKKYVELRGFYKPEFSFIGICEGASFLLSHMSKCIEFKKMLLVNMPISYKLGETVNLLSNIDRNKLKFVYGDKDPSYRYTPLLKRMYAEVITISGADHYFSDKSCSFIDIQKLL